MKKKLHYWIWIGREWTKVTNAVQVKNGALHWHIRSEHANGFSKAGDWELSADKPEPKAVAR